MAIRAGQDVLDKLRQVLTQIGNSLGFVRMVRTAGMRSMADGLEYLEARHRDVKTTTVLNLSEMIKKKLANRPNKNCFANFFAIAEMKVERV